MSKLKPLPEAVRSSVRSGIILYNLTKVVEELVFNSLDAGATKVSIAVGVGTCFVKVADNGSGVDRDGLVLLGERYATSKHNLLADLDTNYGSFGFHGEALCSISDVSLLEIITKAHGRPHGYRKVMKGTKCLYLGINNDRHDMGTTVVVRDLFYNQPVRRKHMQSSPKKVLHSVKKCVLRIALVHSRVSFRVVDVESEEELLSTCSSPSPLTLLSSNFGIEAASSLNEIKVSEGELKLYGYLSGPFGILSLKAFQYIYINSRFVCKGPIHKLLNHLAAGYWDDKEINIGAQNEKRSTSQICPTFILNLSCPRSNYDITFEPLKNSVEFVDWGPVLVFVQNTVSHFWSEKISDVNRESGKKRCRTHKWQVSAEVPSSKSQKLIEDHNKLLAWRGGLSSCQKSNGNASELKKNQTDALFIHDNDCAVQSCDASLFHSGEETNKKIPSPMQLSGNSFYDEENRLVVELSTKDTGNKEVEYFLDSEWQDKSFEMEDSMNMSIRSPLYSHCHEFSYAADCNHVFREPSQLNCFIERSLEYVRPSFASKVGIEFRSDDFNMQQQKWVDLGEGVDAGEQDDIDQIFNESLSRKGEVKSLWSFSRCTNQRVKRTNSNVFSQDLRSSLIAGESSDEEGNYLLSNSLQHIEQSGCNRSSTSEGPLAPNSLFTTDIPSVDHFIGQDVIFDGRGTRCDYFPDREGEYCNFNLDTAVNSWDLENSTDFSSDSKFYADFQEDVSEVTGHKLKDSRFPNCSSMFLDDMDWLHIHSCGENNLPNSSDYSNYYSLPEQSDRIKRGRIEVRNDKTMLHHNGPRRSHSAPPFYKRRRKYFALNNFLRVENGRTKSPVINSDSSLPETGNLQHPQRLFGQCHFASKASYVDESLLLPRLDNKGFQKKGQCINNCMLNPVEDPTSKEIPDVSDSGLKWRDSCKETAGALKSHHDTILDVSSGILHLVGDSLVPSSIDKNYLKDAKVLQQVDKKFIPVVAGRLLAIIDQHAADERIRLEELRQKVLSGEMKQVNYLEAEQELVLPEIGYQLLHSYVEQVQSWGWICNIYCPGSRSFGKNLNVLHRQPTVAKLVAVPCILGVNLTDTDLLEFLQQLADTDGSSTIPPSVHRVLNNKACRGAIMFGDTLLPSECSLIVEELKQTSLCFQCAHGRPTTVPLVNLDVLHKQIDKLALCRSGAHELWQGLCRHEISLERAACRLSSAID